MTRELKSLSTKKVVIAIRRDNHKFYMLHSYPDKGIRDIVEISADTYYCLLIEDLKYGEK